MFEHNNLRCWIQVYRLLIAVQASELSKGVENDMVAAASGGVRRSVVCCGKTLFRMRVDCLRDVGESRRIWNRNLTCNQVRNP
jgi:hypothetical protein